VSKDKLDIVCIGNAIVDVLSKTTDGFLKENRINKGTMTLIESAQAEALYSKMGPAMEMSGGSAANTAAAFASIGGKAGFIGKVAGDQLGAVFRHDLRAAGVFFETLPLNGVPTARCMILVTPDAHRTMCTNLGASSMLNANDLDEKMIEGAKVTYLEGYLFDKEQAKQAFRKAAEMAHAAGKKVALTLSDPFCVERHREAFLDLVNNHVDILFANEAEILSLYKLKDVHDVEPRCEIIAITRSAKGSIIVTEKEKVEVKAAPVTHVVDTTGAGDCYAAGFLYGYTHGKNIVQCGTIGSLVAAEVIVQMGARPQTNLEYLLKEKNAI
jgi:sugar/nucleoside kinase (ribokinase family)